MPSVSWGPSGRDFRGTADDVLAILGTPTYYSAKGWKYGESVITFDATGNVAGIQNKGELKFSQSGDRGFLAGSSLPRR